MGTVSPTAKRIGVMGGTFDPIHYGHLVTGEGACAEFALDQVLFVPAGQPPHKAAYEVSPAHHRYMMTVLATLSNPRFHVSRVDIDREGPSYTIDTLRLLKDQCGDECELYFITGADAILEILTWKDAEELLNNWRFIAATRPGFPLETLRERLGELWPQCEGRISFLQIPALAISSSDIRQRVRQGRPIRYLLPDAVAHYIEKSGLYKAEPRRDGQTGPAGIGLAEAAPGEPVAVGRRGGGTRRP